MAKNRLLFLKVSSKGIVDASGRPVILKGVSLGGWLMMEGYMSCGRNIPEQEFRRLFKDALGEKALSDFVKSFRDTFITEKDIKIIKSWGANCIRVPFNHKLIEQQKSPYGIDRKGLGYLDRVIDWCEKYGLYVILDMHAAPGAQSYDWHADSSGESEFFTKKNDRERYLRLWRFLAARYKNRSCICGYDILNEPFRGFDKEHMIKDLYDAATREIRRIDKNHIIFLEGNYWAQRLDFLGKPKDKNTCYSVHFYAPAEFTFNQVLDCIYPSSGKKGFWNKKTLRAVLRPYRDISKKYGVPMYVGEFGINWRCNKFGELRWVADTLDIMRGFGMHWTYWTYKTVANTLFPDGIYRYVQNPAWVNRIGPASGWETFARLWPAMRKDIVSSWRTEKHTLNKGLLLLLKRHFR